MTQEWISIDKKLPRIGKRVLTFTRHKSYRVAFRITEYDGKRSYVWSTGLGESMSKTVVTHWMPLSPPPKS